MILDASAIIAIMLGEPGADPIITKIAAADTLTVGAPTLAEAAIVLGHRMGDDARGVLIQFIHQWNVAVIPFGERHWQEAADAYMRFGKGRHKAGLNFGDCMSYAVARLSGGKLLFTGKDFTKTDIDPA